MKSAPRLSGPSIAMVMLVCMACADLKPDVGKLHPPRANGGANGGDGGNASGGNANTNTGTNGEDPDASTPEDSGAPDNGCAIKDSNPAEDVSFERDVLAVMDGCRCHDPEDADPFGILESGLTIVDYVSLRKGGDNTHSAIIVDGNPCESLLLEKLREAPTFGDRMPLDGPYLSEAQIQLISDWIAEGARDN